MARNSGHYPLLGRGDVNLYSLFVERACALVKPGGMIGLLTPSGIASDLSASAFFRKVATGGHLKALYDFENRRTRIQIGALLSGRRQPVQVLRLDIWTSANVPQREVRVLPPIKAEERSESDRVFRLTAADFASVNPNTGTAPVFRLRRDMTLTAAIYARLPVLVNRSTGAPVEAWPVRYVRMFYMTNDSSLFRTLQELKTRRERGALAAN